MKHVLVTIFALFAIYFSSNAKDFMVYADFAPTGKMGYRTAEGEWVMKPVADRLLADSALVSDNADYVFVVDGKKGKSVVNKDGDVLVGPYKDIVFITPVRRNYPGFPHVVNKGKANGVMVEMDYDFKTHLSKTQLIDLESGEFLLKQPIYATFHELKDEWQKRIDINRESGIIVINYPALHESDMTDPNDVLGHPRTPIKLDWGLDKGVTSFQVDSVCVLDFNGKDILPRTQVIKQWVHNPYKEMPTKHYQGEKLIDAKKYNRPVGSVIVDGTPCVVTVPYWQHKQLLDQPYLSTTNSSIYTLDGQKLKMPNLKYSKEIGPYIWYKDGNLTYNWKRMPYLAHPRMAKGLEGTVKEQSAKYPLVAQVRNALKDFEKRQEKGKIAMQERIERERKSAPDYIPTLAERKTLSVTTDSVFSIIEFNGRQGMAVNQTQLTLPCIYDSIRVMPEYPNLFIVYSDNRIALSNGYEITVPFGFHHIQTRPDGVIVMRRWHADDEIQDNEYVEFVDSTGYAFANNLDDQLGKILPDGLNLNDNKVKDQISSNIFFLSQNGDALNRKFVRPYADFYAAKIMDDAGQVWEARRYYYHAYNADSRLWQAKDRYNVLDSIIKEDEKRQREEEYRIYQEQQEQARIVQESARQSRAQALSQALFALSNMASSINQSVSQYKATKSSRNAHSATGTKTYNNNTSTNRSSNSSTTSKVSPSAADVSNRNRDHQTYMNWGSKLQSMKTRTWPYSNGYTMSDVNGAQSAMRSIRQKWESRGMWSYGKHSLEDWNGR